MKVPFNKPLVLDDHQNYLSEALKHGQLSGNGPFSKKCEDLLEKQLGHRARVVGSATDALEMMALLGDIAPGDEVIVPSFTFVSTANAFALRGAKLRFADNDDNGNILPSEVARLMNKKTRAVLVMDYAGGSADLDPIRDLCEQNKAWLFEDAAQAVGATYKGRPLGTIGDLGCFSFHDTKNVTAGEGGALLFRDERLMAKAEIIREKGTNRTQFLLGLVDKYTWVGVGSNYLLSELNAAYLYPQLERLASINGQRRELCARYERELADKLVKLEVRVLQPPAHNRPNGHMFALIFPSGELRNAFITHMKENGVTCPFHYIPLHTSPFGLSYYPGAPERLAGCEKISSCLVRLPLYYNMSGAEQDYVIAKARAWFSAN